MSFEESGYVQFWNAEQHSELCLILSLESEPEGSLTIRFENSEGVEDLLELELRPDGRLALRNQEIPWERL